MKLPDHLLPFQVEDTTKLLERPRRLLLEPMGAGKSVMAIAACEALDAYTIVILCPAILVADWRAKFTRFGGQNYQFRAEGPGRRVLVTSYESVNSPARRDKFLRHVASIDVLILDEAQRLKSVGAQTTTSVYGKDADGTGMIALAKHVWILSGTLCPNHVGELYTHLRACFPSALPRTAGKPLTYFAFLDRFCHWESTARGLKVLGNKDTDTLRRILRELVISREREEIDRLLPPLTVATVALPYSTLDVESYERFVVTDDGQALAQALAMHADGGFDFEALPLAAARHALGDLKAGGCADYVRQILIDDPSAAILIFAHHHSVMRRIAFDLNDLLNVVPVIDAETPPRLREHYIEYFQSGMLRVLILGIGTAREGVTLTAANRVVFAEAAWSPAANDQAIHRAARLGQTRPVIAEFLSVTDTLDEAVMRVCTRKTTLLAEVFEDPS